MRRRRIDGNPERDSEKLILQGTTKVPTPLNLAAASETLLVQDIGLSSIHICLETTP
jgi:hypothetical protein